jgi:hypothetical protein
MATLEGEDTSTPVAKEGPDGGLLLPVLGGENVSTTAGASGASSTPRVSIEREGIARRSVR